MSDDVKDGVRFGCHVDLLDGEEPDGCVIDYGDHGSCFYARTPTGRDRRSKWSCKYWRPMVDN